MSASGSHEPSADEVSVDQDGESVDPASYNDKMFNDGCRETDFILVYNNKKTGEVNETQNETFRQTFIENLEQVGLEFEYRDHMTLEDHVFVKIHIPWSVLLKYAEAFKLKMPISENDIIEEKPQQCCNSLKFYFDYDREELPKLQKYFTTMFSRTSGESFLLKENEKGRFFTPAQRSLLVYFVLSMTAYEDNEDSSLNKSGIHRLLSSKIYLAAFPLHSGPKTRPDGDVLPNLRAQLFDTWACKNSWHREQPFDHIRLYFGERIAMYFCWLGFYTKMLFPVTLIGIGLFFVSAAVVRNEGAYVNEICDTSGPGKTIMCPVCDQYCPYWRLSETCSSTILNGLFDNFQSVVFAAFMALWCSLFLELWKRRQAHIQFRWHVYDFRGIERIRPEYLNLKAKKKLNPVNNLMEPNIGTLHVLKIYSTSASTVLFMLSLVVASVFAVVVYRLAIRTLLNKTSIKNIKGYEHWMTISSASCINLVFILLLGQFYNRLAFRLTDYEMHRTQSEWENSYILKVFLFEFINQNAALLYIAFFKGKYIGQPNKYYRISGYRFEVCGPEGCLAELVISLGIIFVAKQAANTIYNVLKILIVNFMRKKKLTVKKEVYEQMEKDFTLMPVPQFALINEYIEMVLQYAYVTVYSAAFPLGPLFALLNNSIEIRIDAYKFVTQYRRPVARRAQDIGIWYGIIKGISIFAVLSNATIIATTSDFIPRLVYKEMFNNGQVNVTYTMFTLSLFNVSQFEEAARPKDPTLDGENVTLCYYQGYRHPPAHDNLKQQPPYELTLVFWKMLAYRVIFILIFCVGIGVLGWLISALIPDMPHTVKLQIEREKHLAQITLIEAGKKFESRENMTPSITVTSTSMNSEESVS